MNNGQRDALFRTIWECPSTCLDIYTYMFIHSLRFKKVHPPVWRVPWSGRGPGPWSPPSAAPSVGGEWVLRRPPSSRTPWGHRPATPDAASSERKISLKEMTLFKFKDSARTHLKSIHFFKPLKILMKYLPCWRKIWGWGWPIRDKRTGMECIDGSILRSHIHVSGCPRFFENWFKTFLRPI